MDNFSLKNVMIMFYCQTGWQFFTDKLTEFLNIYRFYKKITEAAPIEILE